MNGTLKYISYSLLVLLLGFWLRAGYIWCWPFEPLVIHSFEVLDADNVVTAGENLYYVVRFTKNTDAPAHLSRRLANSYVITLPTMEGHNPKGEHRLKAVVPIPEFADPGIYRLHATYTYQLFSYPTRTIVVNAMSPPFLVAKKIDPEVKKNTEDIREMKDKVERDEKVLRRHRKLSIYDRAK